MIVLDTQGVLTYLDKLPAKLLTVIFLELPSKASLDTKSQLFSARSNDNPKFEATGVTIQDALSELNNDLNFLFWRRVP